MRPLRFDYPVITNSDYTEELSFQVGDEYLDLSGHSFLAQIRLTPSGATVFATLPTTAVSSSDGFFVPDPESGTVQVRVKWETIHAMFLSALPEYLEGDKASLYYDMLVTLPGGDQEIWLFGYFNIGRGITNG